MDSTRFDDLLRSLGRGGSRRAAIGAALSGLIASGPLALMDNDAQAKKKHKKKKKKKSCKKKKCSECQVCQKGKCLAKADGTPCSDGACQGGICIDVNNCPPDQVCEISEICCADDVLCTADNACFCEPSEFALCSCPAGDTVCTGTQADSCCLPGDDCDESGVCVTGTCSAGNAVCQVEQAACGSNCLCFTAADDSQVCGDMEDREQLCTDNSECTDNDGCTGDDVCVDVSCCAETGFVGLCVPECAANRMSERAAKHSARLQLPLHATRH